MLARGAGIALTVAMLLPLVSCAPSGAAVGDTNAHGSASQSSGVERGDVSIGMIGSHAASADDLVLDAYDAAGLSASYVSLADAVRPAACGQRAVRDMVARQVTLIVVSGLDAAQDVQGWNSALMAARDAGIPVVLVDPVHAPSDARLYAVSFTINDRATDAMPIDKASMLVINDRPHARNLMVTTLRR